MAKFFINDIIVIDGTITYTQTETQKIESVVERDLLQFDIEYADKVEDFEFYESEMARIQAIIDDPATSKGAKKILREQKKAAKQLRNLYEDEIQGIFEPINAVVNP